MSDPAKANDGTDLEKHGRFIALIRNPQIQRAVRQALLTLMGIMIGRGLITAADADLAKAIFEIVAPLVISILTIVWGQMAATPKARIAEVAQMPEVTKIVVKDDATGGVAKAVKDADLTKVVPESSQVVSTTDTAAGSGNSPR